MQRTSAWGTTLTDRDHRDHRRTDVGLVLMTALLALVAVPAQGRQAPADTAAVAAPARAAADPTGTAVPARPDPDVRRLLAAAPSATTRLVPQSHPGLEIAEPYYGGLGETEVRAASAVTGEGLGLYLDDDAARGRLAAARREVEVMLAVARTAPGERLSEDLRNAGRALGVAGDPSVSVEVATVLRELVVEHVTAPMRLVGVEPDAAVVLEGLRTALSAIGHDPGGRVDGADLDALEAAAAARAGPLIHASGHHPGRRVDTGDLAAMVRAVGHEPGSSTQAGDVAAALGRARSLHLGGVSEVSPGLTHRGVVARLSGGQVVGNLLQWRLDDERVVVRTEQTGDFTGRVSVPAMAAARPTAVAAVNGGFWLDASDPDGLLVTDGHLLSDPTMTRSWIRGRRGGFALLETGAAVGAPDWSASLSGGDPGAGVVAVRGVNRRTGANDLVAYTDRFGPSTRTRPGTTEVTIAASAPLTATGVLTAAVVAVGANGNAPIAPGTMVLAASGPVSARLLLLAASGTIHLHVQVPAGWSDARQGLTGGPLMLQSGRPTTTADWRSEGFAASHTDRRHPRTVVGFDAFGNGLVLVLDGRQPGYSVGATHAEATLLARALGMIDAVMMDGGGSSQLVVHGVIANRPCCDTSPRPVATAITFHRR